MVDTCLYPGRGNVSRFATAAAGSGLLAVLNRQRDKIASMKQTAGTLLYRVHGEELELLLVHPSGNYNRKAPWSIPKGEPDAGEDLELAARRETLEETGVTAGELVPLGFVDYTKSRKRIFCFAGPAPLDCQPRCASWEVDKAEFISAAEALRLIHPDQSVFIERLAAQLSGRTLK